MYLSHLVIRLKLEDPMSPEDQDQGQHKQQREDLPQKKKNIGQSNTRTTKSYLKV